MFSSSDAGALCSDLIFRQFGEKLSEDPNLSSSNHLPLQSIMEASKPPLRLSFAWKVSQSYSPAFSKLFGYGGNYLPTHIPAITALDLLVCKPCGAHLLHRYLNLLTPLDQAWRMLG